MINIGGDTLIKSIDKNVYKHALKVFALATIILMITTIITYFCHPAINDVKHLGNSSTNISSNPQGLSKVWHFIVNNGCFVPVQMFILALIPIPFLYMLNIVISVIIPGIMFGIFLNFDLHKAFTAIIAYIPHYTLEIMAYCILASGLYMLNKAIVRKVTNLFRKKKKDNYPFKKSLFKVIKIYFIFTLPLIILAAFTETYVADWIYQLMN